MSTASTESLCAMAQTPTANTVKFPQAKEPGSPPMQPLQRQDTGHTGHTGLRRDRHVGRGGELMQGCESVCMCVCVCVTQERRDIPQVRGKKEAEPELTIL